MKINWFHRLFNPHCEHCEELEREQRICNSCENLKHELEMLRIERDKLLDSIINPKQVEQSVSNEDTELKPILPQRIPWNVRKQMLEAEDRNKARAMREAVQPDAVKTTEELEKELLQENAG